MAAATRALLLTSRWNRAGFGRCRVHAPASRVRAPAGSGQRAAVDGNLTLGVVFEAGDHIQHGGLAAAAGAEKAEELAFLDLQVEVLQRLIVCSAYRPVGLADARQFDQGSQNCTPRVSAPSTTRFVPVMKLAAGLARKTTPRAISSGLPIRPVGFSASACL
jgi:hypothetical protein